MKTSEKYVLGIESTAHTFGVGVASSSGRILANIRYVYKPKEGGIHPREAAQHHSQIASKAVREALSQAGMKSQDLDGIAFSIGPGMGPCLRVGATIARALALKLRKPLLGVNHGVAHIEIGRLSTGCRDPVVLYVAGGNTLITGYMDGRYRIFGETLDIAAGNCLDVFGIKAGIGPMPAPEEHARRGEKFHPLPYRVKGMDVSFSGLLTAALKMLGKIRLEDLCLSITETVYSMLTETLERALAYTEKREILLVGGLARSMRLREMIEEMAKLHGAKVYAVPPEYAGDNGAMIAWTGALQLLAGQELRVEESRVRPRFRIDEAEAPWREAGL